MTYIHPYNAVDVKVRLSVHTCISNNYLRYIHKRTSVLHIINFRNTLIPSHGKNVLNYKDLIKIAICNCILGVHREKYGQRNGQTTIYKTLL
jgi:hypothetical protein